MGLLYPFEVGLCNKLDGVKKILRATLCQTGAGGVVLKWTNRIKAGEDRDYLRSLGSASSEVS